MTNSLLFLTTQPTQATYQVSSSSPHNPHKQLTNKTLRLNRLSFVVMLLFTPSLQAVIYAEGRAFTFQHLLNKALYSPLTLKNYKISSKISAAYHPSKFNYLQRFPPPQQPLYFPTKATTNRPNSLSTQTDFSSTLTSTPTYYCSTSLLCNKVLPRSATIKYNLGYLYINASLCTHLSSQNMIYFPSPIVHSTLSSDSHPNYLNSLVQKTHTTTTY